MGAPVRARIGWHRRLDVRLTLLLLLLLAGISLALVLLAREYDRRASLEASQRMNVALARYIADMHALFDADGRVLAPAVRELAEHVMKINPALEVYLLDAQARIVAHALDGPAPILDRVNPAPFAAMLPPGAAAPRLPAYADDPRRPGRQAIFSVAAIDIPGVPVERSDAATGAAARHAGFLYIVLDGAGREQLAGPVREGGSSWSRDTLREAAAVFALMLTGGALAFLLALRRLTRPLRLLTRQVQAVGLVNDRASTSGRGDDLAMLADAIAAMRRRIDEQFARIASKERERRELIGSISHDLKTPLANVQGYVESLLLEDATLAPVERVARLRIALRHTRRIGDRITSLFELSQIQSAPERVDVEPFVLAELLQDIVHGYRLAAQAAGVDVVLRLDATRTERVLADIASIDRILQNLIDNSLRHTPRGGTVEVATLAPADPGQDPRPADGFAPTDDPGRITIRVSDTGCGIEADDLPHVCDQGWSNSRPSPDATPVCGLGLTIATRIAQQHGSGLTIRSSPGVGTVVAFSLARVR